MAAQADELRGGPAREEQQPSLPPVDRTRPYCSGCGSRHGLGWCPHAIRLTREHLERRGAEFNWR